MTDVLRNESMIPDPTPADGTPRPAGAARRAARIAAAVGALGAAVGIAYLATRGENVSSSAARAHDHGAMAGGGDTPARPVTLGAEQAERIGVTYAPATLGPMRREIRAVGQVTFDETRVRAITPKVDGFVERLVVDYTGQQVAAGQALLSIYSPMLVTAQEELLLARRLLADVQGGSEEARRSATDLLASARRRLAYWDVPESEIARIERAGAPSRALTLRAPFGGHVLEKNVLTGQRIMAGDVLYRVADLSTVWVEGEVFEQDLAAARVGEMVHADFQALPGEHRMGRIAYVYPTLDPNTRTARVRVELANPGLRLKPGMYATIRIEGVATENALTVPRSAVMVTGERSLVFVRRSDGRLEPRDVRVGAANDQRIEIISGLVVGETVVSSATFLIDAESNLGSALGTMGADPAPTMPGDATGAADPRAGGSAAPPADPHAGHRMPTAEPPTAKPSAKPARPAAKPPADPHAGHAGHSHDEA